MTGLTEAVLSYAILSLILGAYVSTRLRTLFELRSQIFEEAEEPS